MREDKDEGDDGRPPIDMQADDRRTVAERIMEGQLTIAILAMTEVAGQIAAADLPWSDVKTIMLGNRAESILSDLDHMMVRVREQPPTDLAMRPSNDNLPESS